MEVVMLHKDSNAQQIDSFASSVRRLVANDYVPYGKPYSHGSYLIREFVKYSYTPLEDEFETEFEEDEPNADPFEHHDFFEDIEL